jgi:uncharacterized membrane protein (DUF485 family)
MEYLTNNLILNFVFFSFLFINQKAYLKTYNATPHPDEKLEVLIGLAFNISVFLWRFVMVGFYIYWAFVFSLLEAVILLGIVIGVRFILFPIGFWLWSTNFVLAVSVTAIFFLPIQAYIIYINIPTPPYSF